MSQNSECALRTLPELMIDLQSEGGLLVKDPALNLVWSDTNPEWRVPELIFNTPVGVGIVGVEMEYIFIIF